LRDLFNLENRLGFTKIAAVGSHYSKHLEGIVETVGLLDILFFDLVVKEPFVDLNPDEASLLNGFILHLFC
jgi:hypothetical protein